jgi:hypothetical protein
MVLIGVLVAGTSYAQVRTTAQPQGQVSPQLAKGLNSPDMQMSVLRQQIALLQEKQAKQQEQIASLQEKNAHLEHCLGELSHKLKDPHDYDSSVIVQPPASLGAKPCP